jgi:DNA-binding NtrC family response regulator
MMKMNLLAESSLHLSGTAPTAPAQRILIVDDEADIRNFIAEVLNEHNYIADTAPNALVALKMMRDRHYDILLTDYCMPKISGIELVENMRAEGINLAVVLATGHREELLSRHPDLKVSALLEKPFLIEELLDILGRVAQEDVANPVMIDLATSDRGARRTVFF